MGATSTFMSTDGELVTPIHGSNADSSCAIGGFVVNATRIDAWDAIVTLLRALSEENPAYFNCVMSGCRRLSNSRPEVDGLDHLLADSEQDMFDLAVERELRRDAQGYVAPAQAGAFLQMARQVELTANRIVRDPTVETGMVIRRPRALLEGEELAFLANALMSGCALQGRSFTPREAAAAASAVCNLGVENWPPRWPAATGLTGVFEVGWAVLHRDVGMYTAQRLIEILSTVRCNDRDTYLGLEALRTALVRGVRHGAPWRARDALDVIVTLDMPAWAALLGLIAECPVLHAGLSAARQPGTHTIDATAFEFISENSQIATVHAFIESLPELLSMA
jgi:hypothetical protein